MDFTTIREFAKDEFTERKSVFIGQIAPVEDDTQAMEFINSIKKEHRDATHNCWAYILKNGVRRQSDDGEPQGTAGAPISEVVMREGITDVAVVVTRYFGGILLGAGGLIRAYSHGAKIAVDATTRASYFSCKTFQFKIDYNSYNKFMSVTADLECIIEDTIFEEAVIIKGYSLPDNYDGIVKYLTEITSGKVEFVDFEDCDKLF